MLGLEVLGTAPTIGQPVSIDTLAAVDANAAPAAAPAAVKPAAPGGAYGAPPQAMPAYGAPPQAGGAYGAPPAPAYGAPPPPAASAYGAPPPSSYGGAGPVAHADAPPRIVPIASLNAYQNRWTIRGRVTAKSDVRHYSNARGEGRLFSFDLLDEHGGEIRAVGFGDACDRWAGVVQAGAVVTLSRATLKQKRPGPYNTTAHDLEITLDHNSVIQVLQDDHAIPRQRYALRKIATLAQVPPRTGVDVAGVVDAVGPLSTLTRRDGSEAKKRSVTLRDDSGHSVELTLWGAHAEGLGETLDASVNGAGSRPVLVAKGVTVGDYGGRTLSSTGGSALDLDPPDVPAAAALASWWSSDGASSSVIALTGGGGSGGGGRADRRALAGAVAGEAAGGRTAWVQLAGNVTFVKTEAPYYPACPGSFNGKSCNKKMVEDGGAAGWTCARCGHAGPPAWRYMLAFKIADHTGAQWVTAFNDEAAALLGVDASALHAAAGTPAYEAAFAGLTHADLVAKVKVFEEVYQDTPRVKASVQRVERMDYGADLAPTLEALRRVEGGQPPYEAAPPASAPAAGGYGGGYGGGAGFGVAAPAAGGFDGGAAAGGGGGGGGGGQCYRCGVEGHYSRDCPTTGAGGGGAGGAGFGGGGGGAAGGGTCHSCGQAGHWARDCPSKGGGARGGGGYGGGGAGAGFGGGGGSGGAAGGTCSKCGQPGHFARQCPGGGGGGGGGGGWGGGGGGGYGGFQ